MTRVRLWTAGGLSLAALGALAALGRSPRPGVPTCVVERRPFRHEVVAYGHLQAVRSTPVSVPAEVRGPMRISWLAPAGPVKKGELVIAFDPTEAEGQLADGRSDSEAAATKLRKSRAEGAEKAKALDIERSLAEEELRRAEDVAPSDALIFSRIEILESRVDRDLLGKRVATAEAKHRPTELLSAADRALAAIERRRAELRMTQARQTLSALEVRAPHDGILVFPQSWRGDAVGVGDTVWPSQPIAELPDLSTLEARVFVLEGDAGGLAVGQPARIEVEGRPELSVEGKVERVDAVAKNRQRQSPVKYIEAVLSLAGRKGLSLKPGQTVRSSILVAEVADALVIPRGALFEEDGRRFVHRLDGGRFRETEVTTAARSLGSVVVERGVAPGDRLALHDPERRSPEAPGPGAFGPPPSGRAAEAR